MNFLRKPWVAVLLTVVMVVAAIGIGQSKGNSGKYQPDNYAAAQKWGQENYSAYLSFLDDGANLFSGRTEKELAAINGALNYTYGSIVGLATVKDLSGADIVDLTYETAGNLGLGERDFMLLLCEKDEEWYFAPGQDAERYVDNELELIFRSEMARVYEDPDKAILALFQSLGNWYEDQMPQVGKSAGKVVQTMGGIGFFVLLIVILVIGAVLSSALRAGRRMIYGRPRWFFPLVIRSNHHHHGGYHHPGSDPFRSNHRSGGFGGNRGGFGSGRGGFGGNSRGGGFGGGSRGGGFGSGRR